MFALGVTLLSEHSAMEAYTRRGGSINETSAETITKSSGLNKATTEGGHIRYFFQELFARFVPLALWFA